MDLFIVLVGVAILGVAVYGIIKSNSKKSVPTSNDYTGGEVVIDHRPVDGTEDTSTPVSRKRPPLE